MSRRRCQSTSEFGDCWLMGKHGGMHAVPIDADSNCWFGYYRGGEAVGYGHFHDDGEFCTVTYCERPR